MAFFTDSFHETNGVALTSREFAKFAKAHFYPFFSVHAGDETKHWRRGSFETYELGLSRMRLGLEHDLAFDFLFLRHLRKLEAALRSFQPDFVHITGPGHVGMLGAIVAQRLGVPLVASWHTNVHEYGARRLQNALACAPAMVRDGAAAFAERTALALTARFYRLAKMIFAPNPELCAMLSERCNRPVYPMHRGIDCDLFHPERRRTNDGPFVIGYVGRISAEKNVRILAAVETLLCQRGLRNYAFHIVGEGSERTWMEQNLSSAVFHGLLKGEVLADAYAQMDVLLFPSETDTFGNVVLEAAASGVPALVSAGGGPKYLVEDGVTGFVASGAAGYAEAIFKLANSRTLRSEMGAAARIAARSRSWNAVFEGMYQHYRDGRAEGLLPENRRPRQARQKTFHIKTVS